MYLIYAIQHNVTKKLYVGCTTRRRRFRQHECQLKRNKHPSKAMQEDANKYGVDFTPYIIEIFNGTSNDAAARESYWIRYFDSDNPDRGYNYRGVYRTLNIESFPILDQEFLSRFLP